MRSSPLIIQVSLPPGRACRSEPSPGGFFDDGDLLLREAVQLVDEAVDLPIGRLDIALEEDLIIAVLCLQILLSDTENCLPAT